jgi:hypothetical protein
LDKIVGATTINEDDNWIFFGFGLLLLGFVEWCGPLGHEGLFGPGLGHLVGQVQWAPRDPIPAKLRLMGQC